MSSTPRYRKLRDQAHVGYLLCSDRLSEEINVQIEKSLSEEEVKEY